MTERPTGAEALCRALERAGVECVFGLPGTQTVEIYDALRSSRIRSIVPTHELAAAFMAIGYARASGRPGVLLTISGPGVTYAAAGVAEAKLDGVPLVHLTITPAHGPTGEPSFQAFDQAAFAKPIVNATLRARERSEIDRVVHEAFSLATSGEPGPVLVEVSPTALREHGSDNATALSDSGESSRSSADRTALDAALRALASATHPIVFVACDCADGADLLESVATRARMPVLVPAPHRGVMREDHPWMLCCDDQRTSFSKVQEVVQAADLILVLGTRLNHVATGGFRLALPEERVVCVADAGGLPHGYSARMLATCPPVEFLKMLANDTSRFASSWSDADVERWRNRLNAPDGSKPVEPVVAGGTPAAFFASLRAALPRDVILVTDSGLHQVLTRRHFSILAPRGFVFPSDFQSMGFGLPAALGAKLGAPKRGVVVVMGDGGFLMSGLELLTAARDSIPVVVIVLNDGRLNLIRLQQLREFGRTSGVDLQVPNFERFAEAATVRYRTARDDVSQVIQEALAASEPTLVEVVVGDSWSIAGVRAASAAKQTIRRTIGGRAVAWLKRRLR